MYGGREKERSRERDVGMREVAMNHRMKRAEMFLWGIANIFSIVCHNKCTDLTVYCVHSKLRRGIGNVNGVYS